jgi:hypothetical protein
MCRVRPSLSHNPKRCHLERNTVSGEADDCVESKDPYTTAGCDNTKFMGADVKPPRKSRDAPASEQLLIPQYFTNYSFKSKDLKGISSQVYDSKGPRYEIFLSRRIVTDE